MPIRAPAPVPTRALLEDRALEFDRSRPADDRDRPGRDQPVRSTIRTPGCESRGVFSPLAGQRGFVAVSCPVKELPVRSSA
jgi:hypothetical protein